MQSDDECSEILASVKPSLGRRLYRFLVEVEDNEERRIVPGTKVEEAGLKRILKLLRKRSTSMSHAESARKARGLLDYLTTADDTCEVAFGVNVERLNRMVSLLEERQPASASPDDTVDIDSSDLGSGAPMWLRRGREQVTTGSSPEQIARYRNLLRNQTRRVRSLLEDIEREQKRVGSLKDAEPEQEPGETGIEGPHPTASGGTVGPTKKRKAKRQVVEM